MKRIALFALVVGFVFFSCDTGNDTTGDEFIVSINDTISIDDTRLGLIGDSVLSSNTSVATVEIAFDKIKITSVAIGSAVISVFDNSEPANEAKINITVLKNGSINIGTIQKYIGTEQNSFVGIWLWNGTDGEIDGREYMGTPYKFVSLEYAFTENTFVSTQIITVPVSTTIYSEGRYTYNINTASLVLERYKTISDSEWTEDEQTGEPLTITGENTIIVSNTITLTKQNP